MSKYDIDFMKLVAETLPPAKRKTVRTLFLYRLLAWFRKVHAEFITLYDKLSEQAKITSQVIIFESHLVDTFGAGITITVNEITENRAVIYSSNDDRVGAVVIAHDQFTGGSTVKSHSENYESVNFTVNVPIGLGADLDQMSAIINKYKTPGSTYNIVES